MVVSVTRPTANVARSCRVVSLYRLDWQKKLAKMENRMANKSGKKHILKLLTS